jgi:DNA-binding transcriptional ArsR family regulator
MKYELDLSFLENSTETLRAIAHPLRLAIIEVLHQNKRMSVTEIYEQLDIEQAVASHHLRILKDKDVVLVRREGKNSYYTLVSSSFYDILQLLKNK